MSIDIQEAIFQSVRKVQGRTAIELGDTFMRGQRVAIVAEVDEDVVTWLDEEEGEVSGSRDDFRQRALEGVSLGSTGSFLDRAWQIARAASLPAADRLLALRAMLDRAPSREEGEILAGWMGALSLGEEPKR